jgi:hypothetical protein
MNTKRQGTDGEEDTPLVSPQREDTQAPFEGYTETHPAFGTVTIGRGHGGDMTFFGSSIKHNECITLTVRHAERHRGLHRDRVHSTAQIVEVEMSNEQFASMITHLNDGDGTPCTLRQIEGKSVPRVAYVNPNTEFREEFAAKARSVGSKLDAVVMGFERLLSDGRPPMTALRLLLERLKSAQQDVQANMPFVTTQFAEHMEHVVTEAKAEVEAFVTSAVRRAGMEALGDHLQALSVSPASETLKIVKVGE